MTPRLLLDTHVLVRWLSNSKKLSREQGNALGRAVQRSEPVAISAITLMEVALLTSEGKLVLQIDLSDFFQNLRSNPVFRLFPLSHEVASDLATLRLLRDPADRAIVATARVNRLTLLTSDQRIIDSNVVPVIA